MSVRSPMKTLRTIGAYTALAIGVVVGGVAIGALVVAPLVSRAKPLLARNASDVATEVAANVAPDVAEAPNSTVPAATEAPEQSAAPVVEPFRPMANAIKTAAIVDAVEALAKQVTAPKPTRFGIAKAFLARTAERAKGAAASIPGTGWLVLDLTALVALGGAFYLRRRSATRLSADPANRIAAGIVSLPLSGKSSRTPRAVMALAESGASPADIARRTRLPFDAVAMCLSLGSTGARQLRPPTA